MPSEVLASIITSSLQYRKKVNNTALLHFCTPFRVRVRITVSVKLHESSIVKGGRDKSAVVPTILPKKLSINF